MGSPLNRRIETIDPAVDHLIEKWGEFDKSAKFFFNFKK
jgi:hypothetical protein